MSSLSRYKLAFRTPEVTLSIIGQCLDVSRSKSTNREGNQSSLETVCWGRNWIRGWEGSFQASEESVKLVIVMSKEICVSCVFFLPACHWFSMPALPLAGICQRLLENLHFVNCLAGNHAMTSLASGILHHSLAFLPWSDTLNNCPPDCRTTRVDSVSTTNLQLVGSPGKEGWL